jgi:hypothetical protein
MTVYDEIRVRRTLSPAARVNGTANCTAVDLGGVGADSALVVIITGVITDGSHAVSIEDSDDGATGWTAVPAGRLQNGPAPTITAANGDTQFEIGVTVTRRYARVTVVSTGATTGGLFAAVVMAGQSDQVPISHA